MRVKTKEEIEKGMTPEELEIRNRKLARKAELARKNRQYKTGQMETLEAEVARLKARLRIYEPNSELLADDVPAALPSIDISDTSDSGHGHHAVAVAALGYRPTKKSRSRTYANPAAVIVSNNLETDEQNSGFDDTLPKIHEEEADSLANLLPLAQGISRHASPVPFHPFQALSSVSTSQYAMLDKPSKISNPISSVSSALSALPSFATNQSGFGGQSIGSISTSQSQIMDISQLQQQIGSMPSVNPANTTSSSLQVSKAWNQYLVSMQPVVSRTPNK